MIKNRTQIAKTGEEHTCDIILKPTFKNVESYENGELFITSATANEVALMIAELQSLHAKITEAEERNVTDCCNINKEIKAYTDFKNGGKIEVTERTTSC